MDKLRSIFFRSFKVDSLASLIVTILVYILIGVVVGFIIKLLSAVPILSVVCWILGIIVELYVTIGVILAILVFLKVLK